MANEFIIKNGYFSQGSSNITGSLTVSQGITGSLFGTASYAVNSLSSSYSANADLLDGKDSTVFATTGSNTFIGNQVISGSVTITGSLNLIGNSTHTGSVYHSGSKFLIGTFNQTGSLVISGSTTQIGNNNLLGSTTLSGSVIISGSINTPSTPSIKIYGDFETNGVVKFTPVVKNIDTSISGSYIYVSGSTNDLYFSQNGSGYNNVTRLRWLEGNLYTGLLHGGLITTQSSTVYQVSSGSGVIVNLNSSIENDPYPIIQYLEWQNLSASIAPLSASYDQSFIAIDNTANIYAQGTPYNNGQFNTLITIGIVIHQNHSTINAVQTFPSVGYGWKQRSNDFIRAFGPLKISGYTLAPSGSSTGSLVLSGGTSWVDGRNYIVNPNSPSYITEAVGIATSKIYRYHQSGSDWVYNTNNGAGYATIDPTKYSNSGVLTSVPSNDWTIQRVYYFPNSGTKALYIYYGNAHYATEALALAAVSTETFTEAPNTAANAIYVGYMLLRDDANFTVPASYTFYESGLFRGSGGGGGGGTGGSTTLVGLTDVAVLTPTEGQALAYNSTTLRWVNTSSLNVSISGNAATATTASYSLSSSYLNTLNQDLTFNGNLTLNGTASIAYLNVTYETASVIYSSGSNQFGDSTSDTQTLIGRVVVSGSLDVTGSIVTTAGIGVNVSTPISGAFHALSTTGTDTVMYFDGGDGANARLTAAANTIDKLPGLFLFDRNVGDFLNNAISGSVYVALERSTSPQFASRNDALYVNNHPNKGHYFATNNGSLTAVRMIIDGAGNVGIGKYLPTTPLDVYGNVNVTGSIGVSGGITGSLFGTASYSDIATTASYIEIAQTASYVTLAQTASYVENAQTASYLTNAVFKLDTTLVGQDPILYTSISGIPTSSWNSIVITNKQSFLTSSVSSVIIGSGAGQYVSRSVSDVIIGKDAAARANNLVQNILIGQEAGYSSSMMTVNIAVGPSALTNSDGITDSIAIGTFAGANNNNTTSSIYIGYQAGQNTDNSKNNVIIGNYQSLESGRKNSLNLAGVIFSTASADLTEARVGIMVNTPTSASLQVNGNVWATSYTGSLLGTASYAENAQTASYIDPLFVSASAAFYGFNVSSSYSTTASYTDPLFISASAAAAGFGPVITAGGVNGQIQYNNNSAFSGVSVLTYDGSILRGTGSFSGYLEGTASYANLANSASYVESASYSLTSNLSNNTILFNGSDKNVFATTGSNSFTGEQTINGSLTITQNLTVLGSSSIQYITSSQLVIADNIISVNTFSPSLRFGGLAVIDSGSVNNASGSLLFDSQNNQWIFVHQSEGSSAVTSSVLIMGPQTFDNVGNETTITSNRLTKGTGGDLGEHIGDSNITDTGTVVSINSATEITGSVVITAGVTGSSFNISNAPTLNNTNTQILTRNSTTGQIEYSNQSSAYIFNYGLAHAISNFNYLI